MWIFVDVFKHNCFPIPTSVIFKYPWAIIQITNKYLNAQECCCYLPHYCVEKLGCICWL